MAAAYTRRTCARRVHVGHAEHAHHGVTRVTWNHAGRVGVYVWGREAHACHVRLHVSPVWPTRVSHAPAWRCRWGHACHPPPHASLAPLRDNVQRRRASPQVTRVTPKAAGRPRGAHRGGCKARHAPTRVYGTYPRGRTRGGRTWDRRGAPPACGRWCGSGPASGWKARGPRARKRSVGTHVRLACAKPVPCHREGGRTVGRTNPPSRPLHHQKQPQGLPRTPYVLSMF